MSAEKTTYNFLQGGGEMGTLIRETDWSKTPLGDPTTWPQSLRTMVSVLLENPFGMYIAWGNDYTQIYNDGYRPILGATKHPKALGISTRETFSEIWHIIGSMFDGVMDGEAFRFHDLMLPLDRNGYIETCYFDFAYSPIRKENGEVGGVLVTVIETTDKKKAEDNLKESKNQLEFVIEAAQVGTFDYNPLTNKFTGNSRLKEWFGLPSNEQFELANAIDLIDKKEQERVSTAIKRALEFSSGGVYSEEFSIVNALSKKEIIVHAKGRAWFDEEKIAYRLNGTVEDVTDKVIARKKIEESERSLRLMILQAPVAIAIFRGAEYTVEIANKYALAIWGRTEEQVLNRPLFESMPELTTQGIKDYLDDVARTGIRFATSELPVELMKNGALVTSYINFSYEALYDGEGNINGIMAIGVDVTEQVMTRRKVEESELRYNLMLMQSPFAFLILKGKDMKVHLVNESMIDILGKGPNITGKPLLDVIPEIEGQPFPDLLHDVYTTGIPFSANEMPARLLRNGKMEVLYLNYVYQPYYEADKSISGVTVIAYDITAAVMANKIVEENEEKLNIIIEASELGVWDHNVKTTKTTASKRCYEILGYPERTDLTHREMIINIHPEDLIIRKKAFEKAFITGSLHYQARVFHKDKSMHWLDAKGKVFYDENNEPERMLGTIRDITEERNFHKQLLEREEKFRLLADSMPQHIWTSDPEGNLNYFNQSVFDFSGLSLEQINKDGWIQIVHPDDREENIKHWTHSINTGTDFLIEHRFKKHTGEYRWQLSRAIPQKDQNGNIQRWVGTSTDIQEQKMFTTELENMVQLRTNELSQKNMDLEKINKELQSFVYISSHDLQEPLRKIQTFASRIIDTEYNTLSDKARKHFTRMQKSANRMQNLIQDLIAYSRTNAQEISFEIVDLCKIIEETKETLSEEFENKDIRFELTNIGEISVIPVQFQQVVLNLISNSIKFSKSNQPIVIKIDAEVVKGSNIDHEGLQKSKSYTHLRFEDNGIGFEQQYSEKIFDVFQRLHSKDEYTGTGIGLAIVKKIIENHDGVIVANSTLDQGATFDIYLPLD